jgi:DNA-binding CsgD family transcriptional regulator
LEAIGHFSLSVVALAAGDPTALRQAGLAFWRCAELQLPEYDALRLTQLAEADLASDDLPLALRHADEGVTSAIRSNLKYWVMQAHLTRARVAVALGDVDGANHHAHHGLLVARSLDANIGTIEAFECLAGISGDADDRIQRARLAGAADAVRRQIGAVRFAMHQGRYDRDIRALRTSMGEADFDKAWAEGAALSNEEAVAYALRGRGERTRPTAGWASLTPAESEVVGLVGEGLPNKEIAARLFVSPRTVQSHLTHIYAKLAVTSRVQLAQEASRHP